MSFSIDVPSHLRRVHAEHGDLRDLSGAKLVAVNSVMFNNITGPTQDDPLGYEAARFNASLVASRAYAHAGVPQIVLVDKNSHYQVPIKFGQAGAIVVLTPRSGLAMPYLDGARIAQMYAGDQVSVLKAEADKILSPADFETIGEQLRKDYDVLVGDRLDESMQSMSAAQERPESVLDSVIAALLGIPHGASSGVQVYSPEGLKVFFGYEELIPKLGNNWKYLVYVPAAAKRLSLSVTSVPLNLQYDPTMVAAENTPALTLKRLEQLLVMLEGTLEISALLGNDLSHRAPSPERLVIANGMLAALRDLAHSRQSISA